MNVLQTPELTCYRVKEDALTIVPASSKRDWMDQTNSHFAYRCTPMPIANGSGWEMLCPEAFEAEWDGGTLPTSISIRSLTSKEAPKFVVSHFGDAILTFHTGYVFRTNSGWAVWARGIPNASKQGIFPLEGLVETDWLPYTFTMNWRFTNPGVVRFEKDEPVCFLTLCPHASLDSVQPVIKDVSQNPTLEKEYLAWKTERTHFIEKLRKGDEETIKRGWQKTYLNGGLGKKPPSFHITKRDLMCPVMDE